MDALQVRHTLQPLETQFACFYLNSLMLLKTCACAVGGMGAIKRPAEESNDEPSGKKNQPVTAKVLVSPKPATAAQTPKPQNDNKVQCTPHHLFSSPLGSLNCSFCTVGGVFVMI